MLPSKFEVQANELEFATWKRYLKI
jgi:hypothetical protein